LTGDTLAVVTEDSCLNEVNALGEPPPRPGSD
jgi:hypothetical protein